MSAHESCLCGGVHGEWDTEYPCIRQGVSHSPSGCLRRVIPLWQQQNLLQELTGFRAYVDDPKLVFQALMETLSKRPTLGELLYAVTTRVPLYPAREFSPETAGSNTSRVPGPPAGSNITAKPPTVTFVRGPIKPPWEK